MPKFNANLGFLFGELPFDQRVAAAAKAGFKAVEFAPPYKGEKAMLVDQIARAGVEQVLINAPQQIGKVGGRGLACLPGEQTAFQECIGMALDYAMAFGTRKVHVQSGLTPANTDHDLLVRTYAENARWAADKMGEHGITVCLEPINDKVDAPGYFMHDPHLAWKIVLEAAHPHLKLQFDFYHWQIMAGNLAADFKAALPWVGHVQVADTPGRGEPGTGEINYPFIFDWIDACGYDDWVGAEYKPRSGNTVEGLGWIKPYL